MDLYAKDDFVRILAFFYRTMIASVPLLRFASTLSTGPLHDYFVKHIDEERGHEVMQLHDLNALGVSEIPFAHYAAQFAGSQYYLIAHEHPALLLGYMRAMESGVMPAEEVAKLEAHHGIELTCLRHHAIHDPQHSTDLTEMIDALDEPMKARVLWNEMHTRNMLMNARI